MNIKDDNYKYILVTSIMLQKGFWNFMSFHTVFVSFIDIPELYYTRFD